MSKHEDITEVSDPRDITLDNPEPLHTRDPHREGQPDRRGHRRSGHRAGRRKRWHPAAGAQELNLWGHPVDKLRYAIFSWQRVTLLERTHMRR